MSVKTKIAVELENKRRDAQIKAMAFREKVYSTHPMLAELDKKSSALAVEYSKRLIEGEDVKAQMTEKLSQISSQKEDYLKSIGLSSSDFEPKYSCLLCSDTGVVDGALCRCFRLRIIEENFKNSNIGAFLKNQSFESFSLDYYDKEKKQGFPLSPRESMEKNLNDCMDFADNFDKQKKGLFMTGATGLGKTFLSTCIARELLKKGKSVIYISAVDFFKRVEASRFDIYNADLELFENCDLLIIDDLGTEPPGAYATAVFSDILDKRIMREKMMILSTNRTEKDMEKLYGQRVRSRIAGYFRALFFIGNDIRVKRLTKEVDL